MKYNLPKGVRGRVEDGVSAVKEHWGEATTGAVVGLAVSAAAAVPITAAYGLVKLTRQMLGRRTPGSLVKVYAITTAAIGVPLSSYCASTEVASASSAT